MDEALANWKDTLAKLDELDKLAISDMVEISHEKKLEHEILADLAKLRHWEHIHKLAKDIHDAEKKEHLFRQIFNDLYHTLKAIRHLIALVKSCEPEKFHPAVFRPRMGACTPDKRRVLLQQIFILVSHNLHCIHDAFIGGEKEEHKKIRDVIIAIILEQKIIEKEWTEEEIFAAEMVRQMSPVEPRRAHRKLAENILTSLAENTTIKSDDFEEVERGLSEITKKAEDDDLLDKLIKKFRPKWDDKKRKIAINAFKRALEMGHFSDFQEVLIDIIQHNID
jgi:hypothetical protein